MATHAASPHALQHDAAVYLNKRVLLVEDDRLISALAVDLMEHRGISVIGPAETLKAAMEMAQNEQLDAAILDVNLGSETSFAAAAILKQKGIPFFYTTSLVNLEQPEISRETSLAKPYGAMQFFGTLALVLHASRDASDKAS